MDSDDEGVPTEPSATRSARDSSRPGARLLPLGVLFVFSLASVAMFLVSRRVVDDQEQRLLRERTDEVSALLTNSTDSIKSSLQVLGALGSSGDPQAVRLFSQVAAPQLKGGTVALAVAAETGGRFTVLAGAGDSSPGAVLDGARAALASRALAAGQLVSVRFQVGTTTRLALALPTEGPSRAVAYQESVVDPTRPIPRPPGSPFRELRVAVYAAPRVDPSQLLLTTEARVPLTGRVVRVAYPVGADRWILAVGSRQPLVGSFAQYAPWFLLGGGLAAGLLATAMVEVLTRRRAYALTMVGERTGELERALVELGETQAFLERLLTAGPVVATRATIPLQHASYVSPNIERLLGHTESAVLTPEFIPGQVHPDDLPAFRAALANIAEGFAPQANLELRLRHGNGTYRWVSYTFVPETDAHGAPIAVVGYILDVDDRRHAEEAQRDAQEAAEAANRSKSEFLSRMSHELRTPLNAVLGFGQLLELDTLTGEQRESVEQILKGGRHLLDLINEVLDISRIEAGELALSPEPVLASELVEETIGLIRPLADQRSIQLVVDRSGLCDCFVFADRQRTKQVLLNLLSNAVKYNRPRGTVAVTCEQPSETRVRISVVDTGPGIAAERVDQLFAPFERLGAEYTDVEGTGIGLALSRRLSEAMGGTLGMTTELGRGSTFTVELPRVEGPVERYERLNGGSEAAAPVPAAAPPEQRHKVLHIEDNLSNLKLVERILAPRGDIEIVAAMQGRLGLELAHEHHPVLVLLDLHLPDMGGDEVLQRLRDDPVTASIPVVIVSADATPGQVSRLLAAGATAYLTKPIDVRELRSVLDEALHAP
jgi:PAS domain S-box-containing protein